MRLTQIDCELVKGLAAESGIQVQVFERASAKRCCKKSVSLDSTPSKNPNNLLGKGVGQSKSTDSFSSLRCPPQLVLLLREFGNLLPPEARRLVP